MADFPGVATFLERDALLDEIEQLVARASAGQGSMALSFISADKTKTFCIYDGPSPEAIRRVAGLNGLPVDIISEVRVLDPYFYLGAAS